MDKSYLNFIIYQAFETLLAYGEGQSLSMEQLRNYRINVYRDISLYFSECDMYDDIDFEDELDDYLEANGQMKIDEEQKKIESFIKNNQNLFYLKDNQIILKNTVSKETLESIKLQLRCYQNKKGKHICNHIISFSDTLEALEILGAKKVKTEILKLFQIEKNIEDAYQNYSNANNKNAISLGQYFMLAKLKKILNTKAYNISNYFKLIKEIKEDIDTDEELLLISEQLIENDEFYENNYDIDFELDNKFQHAIFGNKVLAWEKLSSYFELIDAKIKENDNLKEEPDQEWEDFLNIYADNDYEEYQDEFECDDETNEFDIDMELPSEIEFLNNQTTTNNIFYLKYIDTVHKYQSKIENNEILENSKKRLLYLLDQYGYELYDEKKLNIIINNLPKKDNIKKKDYYDFYTMSRLFLFDILKYHQKIDELTLRKVLFIKTYYDLTKDEKITRIINKYNSSVEGRRLYDVIVDNNFESLRYFNKNTYPKKLIKNNNN